MSPFFAFVAPAPPRARAGAVTIQAPAALGEECGPIAALLVSPRKRN